MSVDRANMGAAMAKVELHYDETLWSVTGLTSQMV